MSKPDVVAIESDGGHVAALGRAICQHPCSFEVSPIARQPAGDDNGLSQRVIESFHEFAAVDIQAVG